MDSLLRMILNRLFRSLLSRGIDHMARGGRDPARMSDQDRARYHAAKQTGRRAQKAVSIVRRFLK